MPLIDARWTRRSPNTEPFRWLATEPGELFPLDVAERLADDFPKDGYARIDASAGGGGKSYRNYSKVLAGPDGATADLAGLPELWRRLVEEITGGDYRRDVARLLDQPVAPALEVRLARHANGDWLGPHTDRDDKLFSHIVYFNPGWRREWGGCLEILRGSDPGSVAATVVPVLGASALLVRSDSSWHQVSTVAADPVPERTSLLIHGIA
ncbi:2OG-Fe(II) oxygenase family protein [Actinokineospora soli]|uniref:2OG-Fe(II) oxygenase family protein n=1 Tax=Actinokineospora soli TaxID=1048753 RepID=A0ABW2TR85_9PSEU